MLASLERRKKSRNGGFMLANCRDEVNMFLDAKLQMLAMRQG